MSDSVIEFKGLSKDYAFGFLGRKQRALSSLTLDVPRGAIFGFLGANGAGKTTGIKILMGLQFATEGSVKIFGKEPMDPEAKVNMGYLPERPYFHDTMIASEFLNFHRNLFGGMLKGRKLQSNEELLEIVGLPPLADKPLKGFSKGMLQRIGIAQALVNDPQLVILDEPMSGLDPVGRREMRDLILRLSKQGKTIFFSSHILSDVEEICHRFAFLEKGVLKYEGSMTEIRKGASDFQELLFSGVAADRIPTSKNLQKAIKTGDVYILHCDNRANARAAIEELWAAGGTLISCQQEQISLEDFLFGKGRV